VVLRCPSGNILNVLLVAALEDPIECLGVDVYPSGWLQVLQVLVEIFAHVELGELLIDAADLLENFAELLGLSLLLPVVRVHADQPLVKADVGFDALVGGLDVDGECLRE